MASRQSTADFILEQIAQAGDVSARKMFGEYGVYCGEKIPAFICDDQLFVKITPGGKSYIGDVAEGSPYKGAKPCFLIPGDRWEDSDWLAGLIKVTVSELPLPKQKPKKK